MIRGLALVATFASLGCTPATIHLYRHAPLQGDILGGSEESLAVVDMHGERHVVRREDITDVDHPGTGLEVLGGILAVAGAIFFYRSQGDCKWGSDQLSCALPVVPALGGLTLFFVGAEEYRRSEAAEGDRSMVLEPKRRRVIPHPAPVPAGPVSGTASGARTTGDGGIAPADAGDPDAPP